jgi:hypothetical protein
MTVVNVYDIAASNTTINGQPDSDVFRILQGGLFGLDLFGNPGGANTVDFHAGGTLTFDAVGAITNFQFSGPGSPGQFIYLTIDNLLALPGGTIPTFHVTGSMAGHTNEVVIEPSGGSHDVNLSHVTVSNFARANDAFVFDFGGDTLDDRVVGAHNARNLVDFGDSTGNDTAFGGRLNDVFIAGSGNDYFNGGGGINVVDLAGNLNQYSVVKIGTNEYRVHNHAAGAGHGIDTLVNIQYLKFANATVYIGGTVPVITVASSAVHALAAHHVDLIA